MNGEHSETRDREPRTVRRHETYEADHWFVADVEEIDKVFATDVSDSASSESIRVDFDGVAAETSTNDLDDDVEHVNVSGWLPLPEAVELREKLTGAIEDARDNSE